MKPNVVIILNRLVIGGQAIDTIPLAYYLQDAFNVLILYGEKEADELEASFLLQQYPNLQIKKVKQLKRTINPITDIAAFFAIVSHIKNAKATIVHTHGSKSGLLGRWAAWYLKIPVIVHTFHGHLFHSYFNWFVNKLVQFVEKSTAKISTHIIALSEVQKIELSQKFSIAPQKKITVIPLGIDEKFLKKVDEEKRNNFRKKFNLQPTDIAVGIVGRVVPIKNHELFITVAQQIIKNNAHQNVYFFIIGDGENSIKLKKFVQQQLQQASQNNVASKIIFTSWVEDMLWAYYGLDIVMLTSLNEGTPLSIIEAQFCGKPVIASNVGGVKDTFNPNISGVLINGFNVNDYVYALQNLITNQSILQNMSTQAVIFAHKNFTKKMEVEAIKKLYLQNIAAKA